MTMDDDGNFSEEQVRSNEKFTKAEIVNRYGSMREGKNALNEEITRLRREMNQKKHNLSRMVGLIKAINGENSELYGLIKDTRMTL